MIIIIIIMVVMMVMIEIKLMANVGVFGATIPLFFIWCNNTFVSFALSTYMILCFLLFLEKRDCT